MKSTTTTLVLTILSVASLTAQQAPPPTATRVAPGAAPYYVTPEPDMGQGWDFPAQLFPPELVMQHQAKLALTPEQRTAITQAIKDLQSRVVDFQWSMQDESQKLSDLVERATVDEAAVLAQVDKVLDIERAVKKAHLSALIRIRNTLTPSQRETLSEERGWSPRPPNRREAR